MKILLLFLAALFALPLAVTALTLSHSRHAWRIGYVRCLAGHLWRNEITLATAFPALRTWPIVVSGPQCAYVVDESGIEMGARLCH